MPRARESSVRAAGGPAAPPDAAAFVRLERVLVPRFADALSVWTRARGTLEHLIGRLAPSPPPVVPGDPLVWAPEGDGTWAPRPAGPLATDRTLAIAVPEAVLWIVAERAPDGGAFTDDEVARIRDAAMLAADAAQRSALWERMLEARAVGDRASHRWAAAARVSQRLAGAVEVPEAMETLLEAVVPYLADYAILDVVPPDGDPLRRTRHVSEDRSSAPELEGFPFVGGASEETLGRLPPGGLWVRRWSDEHADQLVPAGERAGIERLAPRSLVVVPVAIRGERRGALTLVSAGSGQEFDANDRDLFRQLATQAGLVLSTAVTLSELRRARQDREEMLAIVSHDLRNPLNILGFAASLLASPGASDERTEHQLAIIDRALRQMEELIGNLLDAARIDAGRLTVEPRGLDPELLVREAVDRMIPLADQHGVELRVRIEPGLPALVGDRPRLLQVFQNLLSNALSFTPSGRSVHLEASREEAFVAFEVRDEGPGIEADALPHIFDRYWHSRHQGRAATGLGLTIARGIVLAHGGSIHVRSDPGHGAAFRFTVPARERKGEPERPHPTREMADGA